MKVRATKSRNADTTLDMMAVHNSVAEKEMTVNGHTVEQMCGNMAERR